MTAITAVIIANMLKNIARYGVITSAYGMSIIVPTLAIVNGSIITSSAIIALGFFILSLPSLVHHND